MHALFAGGRVDKDMRRLNWCTYNKSMWSNPRLHLHLDVDATKKEDLQRLPLPAQLDVILDDGSHKYPEQEETLHHLWEKLRPGGFYVIEDLLVGALPWGQWLGKIMPTKNEHCGDECHFPQRLVDHPFMLDRFKQLGKSNATRPSYQPLRPETRNLFFHQADWFWVVTGVHVGGGLDASLVLRKKGDAIAGGAASAVGTPASADEVIEALKRQHEEQKQHLIKRLEAAEAAAAEQGQALKRERAQEQRKEAKSRQSSTPRPIVWLLLLASLVTNLVCLLRYCLAEDMPSDPVELYNRKYRY